MFVFEMLSVFYRFSKIVDERYSSGHEYRGNDGKIFQIVLSYAGPEDVPPDVVRKDSWDNPDMADVHKNLRSFRTRNVGQSAKKATTTKAKKVTTTKKAPKTAPKRKAVEAPQRQKKKAKSVARRQATDDEDEPSDDDNEPSDDRDDDNDAASSGDEDGKPHARDAVKKVTLSRAPTHPDFKRKTPRERTQDPDEKKFVRHVFCNCLNRDGIRCGKNLTPIGVIANTPAFRFDRRHQFLNFDVDWRKSSNDEDIDLDSTAKNTLSLYRRHVVDQSKHKIQIMPRALWVCNLPDLNIHCEELNNTEATTRYKSQAMTRKLNVQIATGKSPYCDATGKLVGKPQEGCDLWDYAKKYNFTRKQQSKLVRKALRLYTIGEKPEREDFMVEYDFDDLTPKRDRNGDLKEGYSSVIDD